MGTIEKEDFMNHFAEHLKEEGISDNDILKMKTAARELTENSKDQSKTIGLLYGRVQSGKTNSTIMSIACMLDTQLFKLFIVLTSDNVSLYQQTLNRIKKGLSSVSVVGYSDIFKGFKNPDDIKKQIKYQGAVIVCTKNAQNLRKLDNFLLQLADEAKIAIIFDDEADFGSLNSRQNKNEESAVYSLVNSIKYRFENTKFIQVTATPQANELQREGGERDIQFTVTVEPGEGYCGGKEFYDLSNTFSVERQRIIPESDIQLIMERSGESDQVPKSLMEALSVFLLGAAVKNHVRPQLENFSMLVHISAKIDVNGQLYEAVKAGLSSIADYLYNSGSDTAVGELLKQSYDNISSTFGSDRLPSYDEALEIIRKHIAQASPQKIISGKSSQDPDYSNFYNILIGGNRLGRGLTIKNLTVFYYARETGAPKLDTILQHSRLYGYRRNVYDIMRVFSTEASFDVLNTVYMSDEEEWEYIKSRKFSTHPPVLIKTGSKRRIAPTRSSIIPADYVVKYFPGRTYFMYHATETNISEIDSLLSGRSGKSDDPEEIDHELAKKLIELTGTDKPEQRWHKETVAKVIDHLKESNMKMYLLVRRDRDLERDYHAVLSGNRENNIWKDDGAILFMYRTSGRGEGWNGEIAWIPVLRLPQDSNAYYLSSGERTDESVGAE